MKNDGVSSRWKNQDLLLHSCAQHRTDLRLEWASGPLEGSQEPGDLPRSLGVRAGGDELLLFLVWEAPPLSLDSQ